MEHDQPEIERRHVGESAWDTLLRAAVAAEFPAMPGEDPADLSEWVRVGKHRDDSPAQPAASCPDA